jgi:hypothetical protein
MESAKKGKGKVLPASTKTNWQRRSELQSKDEATAVSEAASWQSAWIVVQRI